MMAPVTSHTACDPSNLDSSLLNDAQSASIASRSFCAAATCASHASTSPASPAVSDARIFASIRDCHPARRSFTRSAIDREYPLTCSLAFRTRASHFSTIPVSRTYASYSYPSLSFSSCGSARYSSRSASSQIMSRYNATSGRYPSFFA